LDTTLAWGKKLKKPEYCGKLASLAYRLGTHPDYLATAIAVETDGTLDPGFQHKNGAVGLIGFVQKTASDLRYDEGSSETKEFRRATGFRREVP
jgi:hypothetical protein